MKTITMLVGIPGSGKTWITNQLKHKYELVHHDAYIGHAKQPEVYVEAILDKAENCSRPILIEAPFSMSQIMDPLKEAGYHVKPVFIIEHPDVVSGRYHNREGKVIPKGHLTRQNTYHQRALAGKHFAGTSSEVLRHLCDEKT